MPLMDLRWFSTTASSALVCSCAQARALFHAKRSSTMSAGDDWVPHALMARRRLKTIAAGSLPAADEWSYLVRFAGRGEEDDRWVAAADLSADFIAAQLAEAT